MKKLLSILLSTILILGASLGLVSCNEEEYYLTYPPNEIQIVLEDNFDNTYEIPCNRVGANWDYECQEKLEVEYIKNNDTDAIITTKGLYCDGLPLPENLYTIEYGGPHTFYLGSVGHKTGRFMRYYITAYDNNGEKYNLSVVEFDVCVNVILSEDRISDYVEVEKFAYPTEIFACEMQETDKAYYDSHMSSINTRVGMREYGEYEYGHLSESSTGKDNYPDIAHTTYTSIIDRYKMIDGAAYDVSHLIHFETINGEKRDEQFQYTQHKDGKGYILNETNLEFLASKGEIYAGDKSLPSELSNLNAGKNLTYKYGQKDGYLYLSIAGEYIYPSGYTFPYAVGEAIFVIKNQKICAWSFTETKTSNEEQGYWRHTSYCIPFEGAFSHFSEDFLESLCKK